MTTVSVKEHGLLYSAEMVQADLAGRKRQTRRPVTFDNSTTGVGLPRKHWDRLVLDKAWIDGSEDSMQYLHAPVKDIGDGFHAGGVIYRVYPRIEQGDLLWFKETFIDLSKTPVTGAGSEKYKGLNYWYRADNSKENEVVGRWTPSIHMPRRASRITHPVARVRVQRVQDISMHDAFDEGACWTDHHHNGFFEAGSYCVGSYKSLWDSKYGDGPYAWKANPLVWVYDYANSA